MKPYEDRELLDTVRVTGELYNKSVSLAGAVMFLRDLEQYNSNQINQALSKCRKELKFFPSVADVIARIADGRPGVEEAWSMIPRSEDESVIWTDEMAEAWGVSHAIEGDVIAQRMAFKEVYSRLISDARSSGKPPRWIPSLGRNKEMRQAAVEHAVRLGRLSSDHARKLVPELGTDKALPGISDGSRAREIAGLIGQSTKPMPGADA